MSIKDVRDRLNLTQKEVANILGTKQQNVSALERGKEIPDWITKAIALHRLLTKAGYSLDDLILSLPDPVETTVINAVNEKPRAYHSNKHQRPIDANKIPMKS